MVVMDVDQNGQKKMSYSVIDRERQNISKISVFFNHLFDDF